MYIFFKLAIARFQNAAIANNHQQKKNGKLQKCYVIFIISYKLNRF